jgi:hypothetical protein
MMIFPRGEVVHKNLSTVYTDLSALLGTLKLEGFYGAIEIDFPRGRGFLFVDNGEVINGEIRTGANSERVLGQEAVRTLLDLSQQKDGVISIYRLLPEQVTLIANSLKDEVLFKDLSTQFVRLDQFLLKLKEEKHTGFIEVMTKERHPMGVLFIDGGEPVEMFTTPKTGPSVFGRMSIPIFIENAAKQGAFFNVYGKKGESPPVEEPPVEEVSPDPKEEVQANGNGAEPVQSENGWKELILLFQELLTSSERLVDSLSSGGTFEKAFKTALIRKSEKFGFLDPFAGEFEFKNGTVSFVGETGKGEFAKGIVECFRSTLSYFEGALPKNKMVSLKLKAGLESFIEHHREALKRLEAEEIFSSLLR